jgi:hypothetical protein
MKDGERLILRAAEIVGFDSGYLYDDHFPTQEQEGRGKDYKHISFQWNATKAPDELSAVCDVPGKGQFKLRLTAASDYVEISLGIRNDLSRSMKYVDWYFCPVAYEAPSIFNPGLDRTFLFAGDRMRSLASTIVPGQSNETIFVVNGQRSARGFVPPLHGLHPKGKAQAELPLIAVENESRTWSAGLAFERAHSVFSSPGNGCFHADPHFGHDLQPGEQRRVRGRRYFIEGSAADVLKRFQSDFM